MRRGIVALLAGGLLAAGPSSAGATPESTPAVDERGPADPDADDEPSAADSDSESTPAPEAETTGPTASPGETEPDAAGPARPAPSPVDRRALRPSFAPAPRLPTLHGDRARSRSDVQSPADLGLVRQDDGSFVYRDPGRRFSAVILADGRIRFADRWRRPTPPDDRRSDEGRCCGTPPEGVGRALNPFMGIPGSGPAEWAARRGGRQAHAEAKAALMGRTEGFRAQLAVAAYRDRVRVRLSSLPAELETLWAASELSLPDKRRLLFVRWDDCEDALPPTPPGAPASASPSIDRIRHAAAQSARQTIETFIRTHARQGTTAGYPTRQLRRLNRTRQSRETFAPYRRERTP